MGELLAATATGGAVAATVWPLAAGAEAFNRRYVRDLTARMDQFRIPTDRLRLFFWLWWAALFATAGVFGLLLEAPPVAAILVVLVYLAPRWVLAAWVERRRVRLRDQMVLAARQVAAQVRAGLDLPAAVKAVAHDFPAPLGDDLRDVAAAYDDGVPLETSLPALKDRLNIDAVGLFVVAVVTCQEKGGKLPDALATISRSLEEVQRVERKKESDTAAGWLMVKILAAFPFVFLGGYTVLDPQNVRVMYATWSGQGVLCVIVGLVAFSVWLAGRILARVK